MVSNNETRTLPIKGMHCASCAGIITNKLSKLPGVYSVHVNVATEKALVSFNPSEVSVLKMNEAIGPLGYELKADSKTGRLEDNKTGLEIDEAVEEARDEMQSTLPFAAIIFIVMLWEIIARYLVQIPPVPLPMSFLTLVLFVLSSVILIGPGKQFIRAIGTFIVHRVANMDTLIGIGTMVAYVYSSIRILFPDTMSKFGFDETVYFDVVIVVIGFIKLGKYLELKSKRSTGEALKKLMHLQAKTAIVIRGKSETEVAIEDVALGDIVIVRPGASIPLDGEVVWGESSVNESMVTGESLPVDVKKGSAVIGATMNTYGAIHVKVSKLVKDTVLSRIMTMVSEAQGSKAAIEKMVDRVAGVFVPVILWIAGFSVLVWIVVGSIYMPFPQAVVYAITACVGILVIACPCALGLATPTAIIVAVGRAAGMGILIKDAESLEKLHAVTAVVMDKTGTITYGKPVVTDIRPVNAVTERSLVATLVSLEQYSEHPLAHAIVTYGKEHKYALHNVSKFAAIGGKGVRGNIGNKLYAAGNATYMHELGVSIDTRESSVFTTQGKTPLYVAQGTTLLGVVYVADTVKEDAHASVKALQKLGITVVMATGDEHNTATYIAKQVGISRVESNVHPQKKYDVVKALQREGHRVAMVGDGINDAPAIAASDVGIAMSTGTDVAISTANITLLHGDITKVVHAISLSKKTMRIIKENLFWAFIYNIVGIPIAAGILYPLLGIFLSPAFAGLAMAGSSVSVVANSLRLKRVTV